MGGAKATTAAADFGVLPVIIMVSMLDLLRRQQGAADLLFYRLKVRYPYWIFKATTLAADLFFTG